MKSEDVKVYYAREDSVLDVTDIYQKGTMGLNTLFVPLNSFVIQSQRLAESETKVRELEADIKEEYSSNAKRERELVMRNAVLQKKLEKAVEFINSISTRELDSQNIIKRRCLLNELAAITAESIAKTEGEK